MKTIRNLKIRFNDNPIPTRKGENNYGWDIAYEELDDYGRWSKKGFYLEDCLFQALNKYFLHKTGK